MLQLNLTRQEKNTLLVIAAAALLGMSLSFLFKVLPSAGKIYAASFNAKASKININTADKEQLTALSGIGPKTAERIIEYRNRYGNFSDIEQLNNIKGIGNKKLKQIRQFLIIGRIE